MGHRGEAVVLSQRRARVAQSTWPGGKGLVRPSSAHQMLPAHGTGHILHAGTTQHLHSRGTAHTGLCKAKVQQGQHRPRAQSCEDREFLAEKRWSPTPCPANKTATQGKTSPLAAAVPPQTHSVSWAPHGGLCSSYKPFPYLPHHSRGHTC